jgi:hypothetical protein
MALERAVRELRALRRRRQYVPAPGHAACRHQSLAGDTMQVFLNTDHNLAARVEANVAAAMDRFSDRVTRALDKVLGRLEETRAATEPAPGE